MEKIKSRNLEKNIKEMYRYCIKKDFQKAQEILEYNFNLSGEFFIKALRLGLLDSGNINTKIVSEKYKCLKYLNFKEYKEIFKKLLEQ